MRKFLLPFFMLCLLTQLSFAQDVIILDHEAPLTTTNYQFFADGGSLEGVVNSVIPNPNSSGINTSSMVGDFMKAPDGPTWAGGFPNPALQVPLDFSNGSTMVCVKVHMDHIGNLAFKLENSTNGGPVWIRTVENTLINEWEELCFDVTLPGLEDTMEPAVGFTYPQGVLFFDFGTIPTELTTYYFDDIIVKEGNPLSPGAITFSVDMNSYTGTPTQMYVSGTFNGWSGDANPMDDTDGDGIWEATIADIQAGIHEYKFSYDNWTGQEDFSGVNYGCTVTTGDFTNRTMNVNGDATLSTPCYNSCFACGEGVTITINAGGGNLGADLSPNGLFLAGGGNFGVPGDNPMDDSDCDGVYTIAFEKAIGFTSHYTFTNGICPDDWACKEDISGQACADPDNFNDRLMTNVSSDTTINTCFGMCTDDFSSCSSVEGNVTFSVDMTEYTGMFTQMYVSGGFNGWSGDANPMDDTDGDGIWEATLLLPAGCQEYKFSYDNWAGSETLDPALPCVVTPDGTNTNRIVTVNGDATLNTVCYASCAACGVVSTVMITFNVGAAHLADLSPDGIFIAGGGNFGNPGDNPMDDADGDGIYTITIEKPVGFTSNYTFTNGNCPDYSCKENIGGQDCADADNFNDRLMTNVMSDTTINTCFSICTEETVCSVDQSEITFSVDMNQWTDAFTTPYLAGSFNGWAGTADPMDDSDGDGIWTITKTLTNGEHQYKFQLDDWMTDEALEGAGDCTITDGTFTNRLIDVAGDESVCFVFRSCDACLVDADDLVIDANLFKVTPTLANNFTRLTFNDNIEGDKTIVVHNLMGKEIYRTSIDATNLQHDISVAGWTNGLYLITVQTENIIASKKVTKF